MIQPAARLRKAVQRRHLLYIKRTAGGPVGFAANMDGVIVSYGTVFY